MSSNFLTPIKVTDAPDRHHQHFKNHKDFYFSKDGFRATVDLHDFGPGEINVKTVGSYIVVEAKHDERSDSFSVITRSYTRKFFLPDLYDIASVKSVVSCDGVLFLSASTRQSNSERVVVIQKSWKFKTIKCVCVGVESFVYFWLFFGSNCCFCFSLRLVLV